MALIDSGDRQLTVAVAAPPVRPLWLIAPIGALWAALVTLGALAVPVAATWLTSPTAGDWMRAVRTIGLLWAVSLGVPVKVAGVEVSLLPWGLMVLPAAVLVYAGGWMARAAGIGSPREVPKALAIFAAAYGALACAVVLLCRGPGGTAPIARTMLCSVGLAAICVGIGIWRVRRARFAQLIRPDALVAIRAAFAALASLFAFAAVFGAATFIARFPSAEGMIAGLDPGPIGGAVLLLLSIAYLPVVLTWLVGYLLGATIWLGPGAGLGLLSGPATGDLPPLPILAALPDATPPAPWTLAVGALAAGAVLALVVARAGLHGWRHRAGTAACAALLAAMLLAFAAALSSGSLGEGNLAEVGPAPGALGLLALAALCVVALPMTLLMARWTTPEAAGKQKEDDLA